MSRQRRRRRIGRNFAGSAKIVPFRSTTANGLVSCRTRRCRAGLRPSTTLATTTVKFLMRPLVVSHASADGWIVIFRTSSRTIGSVSASGGRAIRSASPPRGWTAAGA